MERNFAIFPKGFLQEVKFVELLDLIYSYMEKNSQGILNKSTVALYYSTA